MDGVTGLVTLQLVTAVTGPVMRWCCLRPRVEAVSASGCEADELQAVGIHLPQDVTSALA